jgi:hypothetical protein
MNYFELKRCFVFNVLVFSVVFVVCSNVRVNADIAIVTSENATEVERIAAGELRFYLG